jgi:hypothetical protein
MGMLTCDPCRKRVKGNLPKDYFADPNVPALILYGRRLDTYSHMELQRVVVAGHITIQQQKAEIEALKQQLHALATNPVSLAVARELDPAQLAMIRRTMH